MDLVTQGTTLLMYSVPFQLQYRYKFLLSSLADSRDLYHKDKVSHNYCCQICSLIFFIITYHTKKIGPFFVFAWKLKINIKN